MNKKVIRVVLPDGVNNCTPEVRKLVQSLSETGVLTLLRDDDEGVCFDINCPARILDSKSWAFINAEKMVSYNAVSAPET